VSAGTSGVGPETPPLPVQLSVEAIARLRSARGWARMLAIMGFVFAGLLALVLLAALGKMKSGLPSGELMLGYVSVALMVIATVAGSALLFGYASALERFFRGGEPALTHAFRSFRQQLALWTVLIGLMSAVSLLSAVKRLLH
jgi:hypothetical protein